VLAAGVAKFGADFVLPDMLHAMFLRSPYAHAKIRHIDTEKARALPGVADILTWEDEELRNLQSYGETFGSPRPFFDNIADRVGAELGAIVVAESEEICEEALRLLEIEWDVYPHVVDLREGRKDDAPIVRPGENHQPVFGAIVADGQPPKHGNVYTSILCTGDPEAGFGEADHIAEYSLRITPFASLMPNPSGSVAWWSKDFYQGEGENLHIEGAVREKDAISRMYGIPPEKTVQNGLFMGGKYCDWGLRKSQEITPLLARRTGRPVRCVNRREDNFDVIMNERLIEMKVGFTNDGLITAMDDFSIADGGVRSSSAFGNVGDLAQGPYNTVKCKNIRQTMEIIDTNRSMMYVSGQHCPYNWDIVTTAIYLISEKLGKDPIDIARLNLHGPESKDDPNPVRSFEMCVSAGKELMDWDWHPSAARQLPDGRMHGASFRYQMSPRHSFVDYHAKLEFRDGVVHMPTQGPIFGVYSIEANAMVVAEELGLEYEDIAVDLDTREPFKTFGGGSDGTTASCWVVKECANILKEKILQSAIHYADNPPPNLPMHGGATPPPGPGPFAGLSPADLDLIDGRVVLKADPAAGVPLAQATPENIFATYSGRPPLALWVTGQMGKKLDTMNTAFCEVAVDTETGEVEILRFGVAADTGKIIRRTSLESQIDQVMYFSQGCQLLEDFFYDPKTGVQLNSNMIEYKKPGMLDVPKVEAVFPESREGNAAYGANGISHSLANTNLVIVAIHNATGVWVEPPATPDKVLQALGKA
jgi:xanthine dehydrogenase molybdenum-binding subunit